MGEAKTSRDASGPYTLSSRRASVENPSTRSRRREHSLDAKMDAGLENVHSPDNCERGTHGGATRQALDLPTRWPRFYSSWVKILPQMSLPPIELSSAATL